ncbi:DUF4153 domain-containing protein [Nocardia lasii]|uniref:DUF4153 domain-containing protein n=1 Tax=Nocardia lasii TaxID=1616107 RepID=A0ABW1JRN3_9NOCA
MSEKSLSETPAEPAESSSVPVTTLLAARRENTDRPAQPWQPAALGPMPALPTMPPPIPPVPPRWRMVARPPGVLPAAAITGIVGATVIPVDRPGIGWLLAGLTTAGALCVVDYRARTRGPEETNSSTSRSAEVSDTPEIDSAAEGVAPTSVDVREPTSDYALGVNTAGAQQNSAPDDDATGVRAQPAVEPSAKVSGASTVVGRPTDGQGDDDSETDPRAGRPVDGISASAAIDAEKPTASATTGPLTGNGTEVGDAKAGPLTDNGTELGNAKTGPLTDNGAELSDTNAGPLTDNGAQLSDTNAGPLTDNGAELSDTNAGPLTDNGAQLSDTKTAPLTDNGTELGGTKAGPLPRDGVDSSTGGHVADPLAGEAADSEAPVAGAQPVSVHDRVWWAVAALALLGVGTFRAAGWLFVLCVIGAGVAGSLAVLGRRSVRGIVHDVFAVPCAVFGAVPWAFSGVRDSRPAQASVRRYGVSVAATAALLVVFVPLLGGADATFAGLLNDLVPTVDAAATWGWIALFVVVAIGALGALYVLAGPPARAADSVRPLRLWSRGEWMLPVGALTTLFAVFVGAQFVALFGGDDYVQRTAGLTYAEYARSGFWQLSAVSILTLAVILAVLHWSVQAHATDRLSLRVLLSAVSVLALVIVGSALARMWTYQQAYGFTVLRLLVTVFELWVGLVYVLVLFAIARLRWTWVTRAALATALGTLIALAVVDPEHLVAERNIDRWQTSGRLDTDYLSSLSPDILPALTPLPTDLRTRIESTIRSEVDNDPWWAWNLSRSSAH